MLKVEYNKDGELTEKFSNEFIMACNLITYTTIENGYIIEKEVMFDLVNYFNKVKHTEKVEFLLTILNKYYKDYLVEKYNESINEEKYEVCQLLKNHI